MTWTGFPVQGGAMLNDLASQTDQIYQAIVQRVVASQTSRRAVNPPMPIILPPSSNSIQQTPWFNWQGVARGIGNYFLHPDRAPGYSLEDYNSFLLSDLTFQSFAEIYEAAGINADGFIRKFPWVTEDSALMSVPVGTHALSGVLGSPISRWTGTQWVAANDRGHADLRTDYGIARIGDVIGPWLWNELKAVLDVFKATISPFVFDLFFPDPAGNLTGYDYLPASGDYTTASAAVSAALAGETSTPTGNIRTWARLYSNSGDDWGADGQAYRGMYITSLANWDATMPQYDLDIYGILHPNGQQSAPSNVIVPEMVGVSGSGNADNAFKLIKTLANARTSTPDRSSFGNKFVEKSFVWPDPTNQLSAADFPLTVDAGTSEIRGASLHRGPMVFRWQFD